MNLYIPLWPVFLIILSLINPVLSISNFATQNGNTVTADLDVTIRNCIFWGDAGFIEDEIVVNKQGTTSFNIIIENSFTRLQMILQILFSQYNKNQYPLFDSINVNKGIYNFRINNPAAPGIDQGVVTPFLKDLDNNNRNIGLPDLGCYEKQ